MDLIGTMEEPMDEVLLSSFVEAGMRVGKPVLHSADPAGLVQDCITGSHTLGSLINAYGFSQDIDGVGQCWKDMGSRPVKSSVWLLYNRTGRRRVAAHCRASRHTLQGPGGLRRVAAHCRASPHAAGLGLYLFASEVSSGRTAKTCFPAGFLCVAPEQRGSRHSSWSLPHDEAKLPRRMVQV